MRLSKKSPHSTIDFLLIACVIILCLCLYTYAEASESVKFVNELKSGLIEPADIAISDNGYIYILDKEAAKVFVFNADGKFIKDLGASGSRQGELFRPNALALSSKGDLIIADTGNSRVQIFRPNGTYLIELGNAGAMPGEFITPNSVAVDQLGYIFVADASKKTISKFSPRGVFLEALPLQHKPMDIAFDVEQNMYVLMPEVGLIMKYPQDGRPKEITYQQGDINYIEHTVNMAVDMRGDIYIIERNDHSVKKIDQAQNLLFSFGSKGEGRGQFNRATGISADGHGKIYIADAKNRRVQILEIIGSKKPNLVAKTEAKNLIDFDMAIPAETTIVDLHMVSGKGLYALSDRYGHILHRGEVSRILGEAEEVMDEFKNPKALYVNTEGQMLVADTGNNRLKFLNPDGSHDYHFGTRGSKNGEFNALSGVAVDTDGFIYVADTNNNRIQVFNSDGIYLRAFGKKSAVPFEEGPPIGHFNMPKDLVFDSKGLLYVLDTKNKRIQVFNKQGGVEKVIGGTNSKVSFSQPIDLDIDEKDYLYVADRAKHKVYIFNPQGELVLDFGSTGKGPSYFPQLSSIAAAEGKIYVADYKVKEIKVYNFDPDGIKIESTNEVIKAKAVTKAEGLEAKAKAPNKAQEKIVKKVEKALTAPANNEVAKAKPVERVFQTQVSYPLYFDTSNKEKYSKAKQVTYNLAVRKLARKLNVPTDSLKGLVKIEAEEMLPSRQMKLTVSAPKEIPVEKLQTPLISKKITEN